MYKSRGRKEENKYNLYSGSLIVSVSRSKKLHVFFFFFFEKAKARQHLASFQ